MSENPHVSIDEIAYITGISDSTIDRIIKSLKDKGMIERKGQKNKPRWIVDSHPKCFKFTFYLYLCPRKIRTNEA